MPPGTARIEGRRFPFGIPADMAIIGRRQAFIRAVVAEGLTSLQSVVLPCRLSWRAKNAGLDESERGE